MKQGKKLTSIGIVICYMGKMPEWFPLWVKSCAANPSVDFLLYTDQQLEKLPGNIICRGMTLRSLQERFSRVLDFECSLEAPYKLCDYKVIYGEAFQEDLRGYDFWGHCDIDMVFGDLRKFITEDILNSYDRIFEVGHLCLYRNRVGTNHLYRKKGALFPYEKVFKEKRYCGFDEHTGMTRLCEINRIKTYKKVVCADIDPHYRAFYMMDEDSVDGEMTVRNYKHQIFTWENGKTWQVYLDHDMSVQKKEVSYIHFMRKHPRAASECIGGNRFCVTNIRFIPLRDSEINVSFILENDYAVDGVMKRLEYLSGFINNGWGAIRKGEFFLRIKLRWHRIKKVNCEVISQVLRAEDMEKKGEK